MQMAGLDWSAEATPAYQFADDGFRKADSVALIRRDDTLAVLGSAGNKYRTHSHVDALSIFDPLVAEGLLRYENAGQVQGGRGVFAVLANTKDIQASPGDIITPRILIHTRHDGTGSTGALGTTNRTSCANTLHFQVRMAKGSRTTHRSLNQVALMNIRSYYRDFLAQTKEFEESAKLLQSRQYSVETLTEFFRDLGLAPDPKGSDRAKARAMNVIDEVLNAVDNSPGAEINSTRSTMWGLVNGITYYVDHVAKGRGGNDDERRTFRTQFGNGSKLKQKAYDKALQLVQA